MIEPSPQRLLANGGTESILLWCWGWGEPCLSTAAIKKRRRGGSVSMFINFQNCTQVVFPSLATTIGNCLDPASPLYKTAKTLWQSLHCLGCGMSEESTETLRFVALQNSSVFGACFPLHSGSALVFQDGLVSASEEGISKRQTDRVELRGCQHL